ncbi:MAG: response regulator [Pseudoalteromonas sp.]|uniref:response regulator transcription factor n=1 Tax=unclassified Pseudoalteromonas TaxID=194690 RepID=UPI000C071A17|nr:MULTISPECIES: response regulator transcription factor [unclassified Pseudoalteromonas]MDP2635922.1 response regulator transcription factor [Pseudoalteromonas sp. 1_MG-2023]PHN88500.1 DNA-binding response regulator [Pseudoalteromonas sp. 3D05]TGE78139.1 DNA-binding response regulator [Pseudoalteromonas sp. KS88]
MNTTHDVLVVDDHPMVCAAIKTALSKSALVNGIYAVASQKEALEYLRVNKCDLIILDIELEESDGFSLYKRACLAGYKGRVLFLSAKQDKHIIRTAAKLGSQGFINKAESLENITSAVELILKGFTFFPQEDLLTHDKDIDQILTERELTVMKHLVEGASNKDIGEKLFISNKTVSTYKTKIFEKLGVDSVISLAKLVDNDSL